MVKTLLTAALLAAFSCQAADFEVGIGLTSFGQAYNGTWYQDGYPHDLHLKSQSFKLGITESVGRWRWHAGLEWLGRYSSTAEAVASDYAYTNNTPYPVSHWVGKGQVYGMYLSAGPQFQLAGLTVHPLFGFYRYRPTWEMSIPDWVPCQDGADGPACAPGSPRPLMVRTARETRTTPIVGLSVGRDRWSMDLTVRRANANSLPTITTGPTWNVGLSWRW